MSNNRQMAQLKRLYPNMTEEEIVSEYRAFDLAMLKQYGGTIDDNSANMHKYQRGWMARANYEKGQQNERTSLPRL